MINHSIEKMESCEIEDITCWLQSENTRFPLNAPQASAEDCSEGGVAFEDPACFLSSKWEA